MKLKSYRTEKKVTLAALADKVGVSEVAMSRYERGERIPRPGVMAKIVQATEGAVQPNDFFDAGPQAAE